MIKEKFFGSPKSHIIYAADLPDWKSNIDILDVIHREIDVIKVCSPLIYRESLSIVSRLLDRYNKPIFADLKVADIPVTSANIVSQVREHGGSAVMVHGIIGPDGVKACVDAAQDDVGIIVQLELTNPGGLMFTAPIANDMASLTCELGIFGTQAPGNRPERVADIREIIGEDKVIVCCGVGHQGGTLQSVLKSGADYAIIGRSIYLSKDPLLAIEDLRIN